VSFKGFGIAFAVFALLVSGVSASGLSLSPSFAQVDACICDTAQLQFAAANTGPISDNYLFSITGDFPWGIVAPATATIDAGQTLPVFSFFTPSCFSQVGVYSFTVKGQSSTESKTSAITLNITPCVSMQDLSPDKAMCYGEKKSFQLTLRNKSRTASKNYTLFVSGNGAAAVTAPAMVFVPSEGSATFAVDIDSMKLDIGNYDAQIRAVSIYSLTGQPTQDEASIDLPFTINDCQRIALTFPTIICNIVEKCDEKPQSFPMIVTNNGELQDTVTVHASNSTVSFAKTVFNLAAGASETTTVTIAKEALNTSTFTIFASSALGAAKARIIEIRSAPCYGVGITSAAAFACSDRGSVQPVIVTNDGLDAQFNFTVSGMPFAYLNETGAFIKHGESRTIGLVITPGIADGNYSPTLTAVSEYSQSENSTQLQLVRCYDVSVAASDDLVCQCEDKAFNVEVINTGYLNDSFRIGVSNAPQWLEFQNVSMEPIAGNTRKTLTPHVYTCDAAPGVYSVVFNAVSLSQNSSGKASLDITLKSKEECYPASVSLSQGEFVECESTLISVNVTNTGLLKSTYVLSVDGPKWISIQPDFLVLEKGETSEAYLVASPPLNEAGNTYNVTVKAVSTGVTSTQSMLLNIVGVGEKVPPRGVPLQMNASATLENGVLTVYAMPGAIVQIRSPSGEGSSYSVDARGVITANATQEGEWKVSVLKAGYEPKTFVFTVAPAVAPQTGLFAGALSGKNAIYLAILAIFAVSGAFVYYQFVIGKKR